MTSQCCDTLCSRCCCGQLMLLSWECGHFLAFRRQNGTSAWWDYALYLRTALHICVRPQPGVSRENILSLHKDGRGGGRMDQDPEVETGECVQTAIWDGFLFSFWPETQTPSPSLFTPCHRGATLKSNIYNRSRRIAHSRLYYQIAFWGRRKLSGEAETMMRQV